LQSLKDIKNIIIKSYLKKWFLKFFLKIKNTGSKGPKKKLSLSGQNEKTQKCPFLVKDGFFDVLILI
jgi:hypothetical protein